MFSFAKQYEGFLVATVPPALATGGTITDFKDSIGRMYKIHSYASAGSFTFTPSQAALNVDVLIVGGGGAGGSFGTNETITNHPGGGGGGGEYKLFSTSLNAQSYSLVVGAGGTSTSGSNGTDGGSSSGFSQTVRGGKGGTQEKGGDSGSGIVGQNKLNYNGYFGGAGAGVKAPSGSIYWGGISGGAGFASPLFSTVITEVGAGGDGPINAYNGGTGSSGFDGSGKGGGGGVATYKANWDPARAIRAGNGGSGGIYIRYRVYPTDFNNALTNVNTFIKHYATYRSQGFLPSQTFTQGSTSYILSNIYNQYKMYASSNYTDETELLTMIALDTNPLTYPTVNTLLTEASKAILRSIIVYFRQNYTDNWNGKLSTTAWSQAMRDALADTSAITIANPTDLSLVNPYISTYWPAFNQSAIQAAKDKMDEYVRKKALVTATSIPNLPSTADKTLLDITTAPFFTNKTADWDTNTQLFAPSSITSNASNSNYSFKASSNNTTAWSGFSTSGTWYASARPTPTAPQWLQITSVFNPVSLKGYSMQIGAFSGGSGDFIMQYQFQGSNDETNWDILDYENDTTRFINYSLNSTLVTKTFPEPTSKYSYFRFFITQMGKCNSIVASNGISFFNCSSSSVTISYNIAQISQCRLFSFSGEVANTKIEQINTLYTKYQNAIDQIDAILIKSDFETTTYEAAMRYIAKADITTDTYNTFVKSKQNQSVTLAEYKAGIRDIVTSLIKVYYGTAAIPDIHAITTSTTEESIAALRSTFLDTLWPAKLGILRTNVGTEATNYESTKGYATQKSLTIAPENNITDANISLYKSYALTTSITRVLNNDFTYKYGAGTGVPTTTVELGESQQSQYPNDWNNTNVFTTSNNIIIRGLTKDNNYLMNYILYDSSASSSGYKLAYLDEIYITFPSPVRIKSFTLRSNVANTVYLFTSTDGRNWPAYNEYAATDSLAADAKKIIQIPDNKTQYVRYYKIRLSAPSSNTAPAVYVNSLSMSSASTAYPVEYPSEVQLLTYLASYFSTRSSGILSGVKESIRTNLRDFYSIYTSINKYIDATSFATLLANTTPVTGSTDAMTSTNGVLIDSSTDIDALTGMNTTYETNLFNVFSKSILAYYTDVYVAAIKYLYSTEVSQTIKNAYASCLTYRNADGTVKPLLADDSYSAIIGDIKMAYDEFLSLLIKRYHTTGPTWLTTLSGNKNTDLAAALVRPSDVLGNYKGYMDTLVSEMKSKTTDMVNEAKRLRLYLGQIGGT